MRLLGFGSRLRARAPVAQDGKPFAAEQIGKGSALYETHCQTCHGPRLANRSGPRTCANFRARTMRASSIP